jgi:membrane-bound metal-dependent hydrolase YbcI (DUF457 family)
MPSPLAHAGITLALLVPGWYAHERPPLKVLFLLCAASLAPDLDVLPMLVDSSGIQWHRGPSHSILGTLVIGGFFSAFTGQHRWRVVLASLLHLPLDWSTGEPGAPLKYGVPLFWPFNDARFLDPNPWFGAYAIDAPGGLKQLFVDSALPIYGREVLTVMLCLLGRRYAATLGSGSNG